jgi:hypothetical protein
MPTEAQLIDALRKADAANDTVAANRFAELIKQKRAEVVAPTQPPMQPEQSMIGGTLRAAGQGMTLGFSDELGGAVGALAAKASGDTAPISDIYADISGGIRADQKRFSAEHPIISTAAEVAGGLPVGGAMFKGAKTLPDIMKAGAKGGALFGGAYGAGTSEGDLVDRAKGATLGATVGGVTGGVVPLAMTGAGRISQAALGRAKIALSPESGKIAKDAAEAMTDDEAAAIVGEIAQRTGMTADDIANKLEKLGSKATLADVDENFAFTLHDAISRFSPAKGAVRSQYAERLLGEHADTIGTLSKQFDNYSADDVYSALEKSAESRRKIAGPMYDVAFAKEIPEGVLDNPKIKHNEVIQKALTAGVKYAKSDPDRLATLTTEKGREFVQKPLMPMERWHYAKKALWDKEQSFRRAGNNEMANNIAKNRKLVDEVLNSSPEYASARKIWSSSLEADNAATVGRDIFKMPAREFEMAIKDMNPHELEMAKMGALSQASEKIEGVADKRSVARKLVENEAMRKKVSALFGGEKQVDALMKNADTWDTFRRTNNLLSQQSKTREFTQANQEITSIMDAVTSGVKEKMMRIITGERMNAERAASVAKILSKEGLTRDEIQRLVQLNKKMFQPGTVTKATQRATSIEATKPIIGMMSEKQTLNDYMQR